MRIKKRYIVKFVKLMGGIGGSIGIGFLMGYFFQQKNIFEVYERQQKRVDKFRSYYDLLNKWLENKNNEKKIQSILQNNHINRIAIYGMGEVGCRLYEELQDSEIEIAYAIDNVCQSTYDEHLKILSMEEKLPKVDAIIITPVFSEKEIRDKLVHKIECPIISIKDIIFEV